MTIPVWPDHLLTLAEWENLPDFERYAVEVQEGILRVSPRPITTHQRAIYKLVEALNGQLPVELNALAEVELLVETTPLTIRIPDVVVIDTSVADEGVSRVDARDAHLVVEVGSPGSARHDRVTKFAEYAEAGIPQYWLVDLDPPVSLAAFTLADDVYHAVGEYTGEARVDCAGTTLALHLDRLTAR